MNFKMTKQLCIMCEQDIDDVHRYGEKITVKDVKKSLLTAHYFCLLLSAALPQKGKDNEGIFGFLPNDIIREAKRAKKMRCTFCKKTGANISCCDDSCRKSFHLSCGLEHGCRFEFVGRFQSFCSNHRNIKKPVRCHTPTETCPICTEQMGKYNAIESIQLPCCRSDSWFHKLCLQKSARTAGYFFKCPLCNDTKTFRNEIVRQGIFIPDCDAKWEETGPNTFHRFEEHTERPSKCEAKICKYEKVRKYQVNLKNYKHSLVYCQYCGSHAAHLGCITGDVFSCEECSIILNQSQRQTQTSLSNCGVIGIRTENQFDEHLRSHNYLILKYKLREFSIRMKRLTPEELGFARKSKDIPHDITNTSQRISKSNDSKIDENWCDVIVISPKRKREIVISTSNNECEIDVKPSKRARLLSLNQFIHKDNLNNQFEDINNNNININVYQ